MGGALHTVLYVGVDRVLELLYASPPYINFTVLSLFRRGPYQDYTTQITVKGHIKICHFTPHAGGPYSEHGFGDGLIAGPGHSSASAQLT